MMDALNGFDYKHNSAVMIETSIGQIELTYRTRDGEAEEYRQAYGMFDGFSETPFSEPARNEPSHFRATLYRDGKPVDTAYAVLPDAAIKELYKWDAVQRMEAEFYPKPYEF
jgi:hypothetical protein